jgi:hypothetical protein
MARNIGILGTVAAALVLLTSSVLAANPHIVGSTTTTFDSSNQFTISGKIAGLGSGFSGSALTGTATATFDIQCSNPNGNLAPGQQGGSSSIPGSGSIDSVAKNGTYTFHITFTINTSPAKAFGCPNNQWTATAINVRNVALTSLQITGGPVIEV